jgi:cytochrome c biogenesis protein ResB
MGRAEAAQGVVRPARTSDLLVWLWRLLASSQFAIALIAFLAFAGLLEVVLPQIPNAMRGNPAAIDAWLDAQKGTYGPFTQSLYRLGLFEVKDAWWFLTGLGLLAVSVCIYALDRFLLTWRTVTQPRERLPDSFFERAANRAAFATPAAGALEGLLRKRRFRVRSVADGDVTYLFADRFAWAQLGNFASHIALILFLVGGLLSHFGGYSQTLFIAEGTTSPVFPVSNPNQMQVQVVQAVARFDAKGSPIDYHSELVIYKGGHEVARGTATVNGPLEYGGYRFHQVGYLGEGAALHVRDVTTGNATYDEVLALTGLQPAPAVTVRDAQGNVLLDDVIPPTDFIDQASGSLITVPGYGRQFWVGVTPAGDKSWSLVVYGREGDTTRLVTPAGQSSSAEGLQWTFNEVTGLPSLSTDQTIPGDNTQDLVMLSQTPQGAPYLTILGPVDGQALTLYPNQPVRIGDREYTFEGQRAFAGIQVRRDPGVDFIWIATGMLIAGLLVTFYIPRLRLWARVRGGETVIAAQAERSGVFRAEAKQLVRALGVAQTEEAKKQDA